MAVTLNTQTTGVFNTLAAATATTLTISGASTFNGAASFTNTVSMSGNVTIFGTITNRRSTPLFNLQTNVSGNPRELDFTDNVGARYNFRIAANFHNNDTLEIMGSDAAGSSTYTNYALKVTASNQQVTIGTNLVFNAGGNIILDTATGTKIGTGTTQKLGFWNATPIVKPTVTGAKSSNAALASLITALANMGLIVDSTSA